MMHSIHLLIILMVPQYFIPKGNILFNDTLNTFYLQLYSIRDMAKDHSDIGRKPIAATTWDTFSARVLLYAPSRQDSRYHGLCYASCGALTGTINSSVGPP